MKGLIEFLTNSLTAYHAVENAAAFLSAKGFQPLSENEIWKLKPNGKYYVIRGGSSIIAFTNGAGKGFRIVASHTDSPCLKLKENPAFGDDNFTRLNTETYGGGIWYSFFDRPLRLAGRAVYADDNGLHAKIFTSDFDVVIPSVAVHMNRGVNDGFAPNPQTDLLPLLAVGKTNFDSIIKNAVSYDLFAVCAETPFTSGMDGEFLSSPRVDNLTSVYASLCAIAEAGNTNGVCIAACFDSEEIGSGTRQGAGSDFFKSVLSRIASAHGESGDNYLSTLSSSFLISLDNAHSLHPNHPELCDPTNRAKMGGGVVIKSHANGAYTTDALTSAVIKTVFDRAGVKYQTFYNRSDMRSGSTLGAISIRQASIPSVDLGIPQLAMHSAVETFLKDDYLEVLKGLTAFYRAEIAVNGNDVTIK